MTRTFQDSRKDKQTLLLIGVTVSMEEDTPRVSRYTINALLQNTRTWT
jgi:hypothetical protein